MNSDFHIASLTIDQREKLNQMENELGVVLIAWSSQSEKETTTNNYEDSSL